MANCNPKVTPIAINALGGQDTDIVMTIMSGKVRVQEDPSYNDGVPQGLSGFEVDTQPGAGAANLTVARRVWLANNAGQTGPAYQPISYGGTEGGREDGGHGEYVGAQGTIILRLTTNSANAGGVLLEEWS